MKPFKFAAFADEAGNDLTTQIHTMKQHGISYLEIRGVDGQNISEITLAKAKEIRERLDDAGIGVWSLGSPYGKIGIKEDFRPHLDLFRHGLELAQALRTKYIRLFSFFIPTGEAPEIYRDEVMARLAQFIEAAKDSGITLCHENEKEIYGDIASRCAEIHHTFPELKAVFDPANFIQCGQDTIPAWEMLSDYVEYMHIKDALWDGTVVPAGAGEGNLPYLLEQYKGTILTLEPHLSVFKGFSELEQESGKTKMPAHTYASSGEAFAAAVEALKNLLKP